MRLPILALALLLCFAAEAAEITGGAVAIADGDTITVLDAGNEQHKVRIRLAGIDAPEKGSAARFALEGPALSARLQARGHGGVR